MHIQFNVLDHGYVKLVESWGSDEAIIEAARMSTAKGFLGWGPRDCHECDGTRMVVGRETCPTCYGTGKLAGDEKLLKYLYEHKHDTPFEFAGAVFEVQAPIFVFREWHRHRTQSYNEMSARYTPLPDVNYIPSIERLMMNSDGKNRQSGTVAGAAVLTEEMARIFQITLRDSYAHQQKVYEEALSFGVPKELARLPIPVARYSRMRASTNLRNWLAFLTLRSDKNPHAQWEIRQFANAVGLFIQQTFPRTWELFNGENR